MAKEKGNFIQDMDLKKGALRKALKVKKGENIPMEKLKKAEQSKNPLMRKRATLAETFRRMR